VSVAPVPLNISYVDPDGNTWNFSDYTMANGYCCSAISGIDGFPVMMQTLPMLDGTAIPITYLPQPGTVGLAILLARPSSDDEHDYYTLLDNFVRAFICRRNEVPTPGTLIIQRFPPNGPTRQINVFTLTGLDNPDVGKNNTMLYTLALQTPNPFWSDLSATQVNFSMPAAGAGILPELPVQLSSPSVFGTNTVTNNGTALAWPTWTITGPGTPTITNQTTGLSWALNTAVPAGQQVQVVTQRGQQMAVNITTGANVWGQLVMNTPRNLWPLVGGRNVISVTMPGSTSASKVNMSYFNQWNRA